MAHFQQTYFGAASARRNAARVPPPTFFASQPPPSPRVVPVLEHREGFQADLDQVFEKGVKEGIRRVYLTLTALVTEVSILLLFRHNCGALRIFFSLFSRTTLRHQKTQAQTSAVNQSRSLPPSPTSSSTVATVQEVSEKFRVPVGYGSAFRSPSVEAELRKLFAAADQGNPVAMKLVQALARKAHETPRDHKSWGQKFLLVEWRNPMGPNPKYSNSTARATTGVANPRLNDPVEDWYLYYTTHSSSLPKGVRRDVQGNPYFPDLRASRLFAQMRPV
ncbi:hypothetical protein V5O48_011961 [Marasmius crinis-equi]|uniref:Uncharacterized protein n=1 Tax=Marasmius crinis-equi TaxID=585013 RepID=A0ABR3F4G8_9AGAR